MLHSSLLAFVISHLNTNTTTEVVSEQFIQCTTQYETSDILRDVLEELYVEWVSAGYVIRRIESIIDGNSVSDIYFDPNVFHNDKYTSLRIIDNQRRYSQVEFLVGTGL